jgi:hypothetical protein
VIVLDEPIEGTLPVIHLPDSEARLHEPFMIAGYGFDGKSDLILGLRRFGRKKVTRLALPGSEGILFEQDGAAFTSGSGEPCLRQEKKGTVLIGITTLVSEEGSAFTSMYQYKDWLRSETRSGLPRPRSPPGVKKEP